MRMKRSSLRGFIPRRGRTRWVRNRCAPLAAAMRRVLKAAIESGGSTLRDYRDAEGRPGWFVHKHHVYGRGGRPCAHCGEPIVTITVAQRTTAFCPTCQTAGA